MSRRLSTIAEIHPFWIHRLIPGSEMIDNMGHKVVSSCRTECNVGLTPGGCTDHPQVAGRMRDFLVATSKRYGWSKNLVGWDCWNETRWNINAENPVCYCSHTLGEFRRWLEETYGSLDGLNNAWQRRYCDWQDVLPGKLPGRTPAEMCDFLRFLTVRAARHARWRYDAIREGDPVGHWGKSQPIVAHCGTTSVRTDGYLYEQPLCRGNDFDLVDQLDGFGSSYFPYWGVSDKGPNDADFGMRLQSACSAVFAKKGQEGKVAWISELQGGAARIGVNADISVDAAAQQRWIAHGLSRGIKGVIFWAWRDEVFGKEASGFGLDGWDGFAPQRLKAMKLTADMIQTHRALIDKYRPAPARVGLLYNPDNYFLQWSNEGTAAQPADSIFGYGHAIERLCIPYEVVSAQHLEVLDRLSVLFMPWSLVMDGPLRDAIIKFVRCGGRILCEAETDSFDKAGFYRYPDQRPLMQAMGVQDMGRRMLDSTPFSVASRQEQFELHPGNFTTPLEDKCGRDSHAPASVLARNPSGQPVIVRAKCGKGAGYVVGTFLGFGYFRQRYEGLERLIAMVCKDAGVEPEFNIMPQDQPGNVSWRLGQSGSRNMLWVINSGPERDILITDNAGLLESARHVTNLRTSRRCNIRGKVGRKELLLGVGAGDYAVLAW